MLQWWWGAVEGWGGVGEESEKVFETESLLS